MSLLNQLKWIRVLPFKHYYKVKRIELEYDKLHLRWKLCKNYNLNCRYFTLKFPQPNTASKEKFLWNNLAKHVTKTLRTTYEGCLPAMIKKNHSSCSAFNFFLHIHNMSKVTLQVWFEDDCVIKQADGDWRVWTLGSESSQGTLLLHSLESNQQALGPQTPKTSFKLFSNLIQIRFATTFLQRWVPNLF